MSKFFSFKLYLQGLKKSRLQGITLMGVVTALTALVPTVTWFSSRHINYEEGYVPTTTMVSYDGFAIPLLLLLFLTPILVLSMFSFLNKRNESDFYHSIPFTRPCVYFSFFAACMTWVVFTLVTSLLSATLLWAVVPYTAVPFALPFVHFIVYFLATLLLAAFTVVAMTLTGTVISNLLILGLLFFFVRVAGAIFIACMESLYSVVIWELSLAEFLQLDYNIPLGLLAPYLLGGDFTVFDNYGLWIYTAVISIGLIAAGCWLYTRRRSEMAGQSAPNNFLQHTYRIMISLPFVFLMVYGIFEEGFSELALVLTVITLLVYYVYEIVTTKRLKNLLKATVFLPVLIVGGIAFALVVTLSGKAAIAYTPDADEIESISIYDPNINHRPTYELMNTTNVAINDPKVLEFVANELKEMKQVISEHDAQYYLYPQQYGEDVYYGSGMALDYEKTDYVRWSVKIVGKSGRVCGRTLCVTIDEYRMLNELFTATKEYEDALLKLPTDSEIVHYDANYIYVEYTETLESLWANFTKEYNALSREEKIEYKTLVLGGEWYEYAISVNGIKGSTNFYSTYPIYPDLFPETARQFVAINNLNEEESFKLALKALNEKNPASVSLNLETEGRYHSIDNQREPIKASMDFLESLDNTDRQGDFIVRITLWTEDDAQGFYYGGTKYYILTPDELYELFGIMGIDGYKNKVEIG